MRDEIGGSVRAQSRPKQKGGADVGWGGLKEGLAYKGVRMKRSRERQRRLSGSGEWRGGVGVGS